MYFKLFVVFVIFALFAYAGASFGGPEGNSKKAQHIFEGYQSFCIILIIQAEIATF